jgi:hypothetical protein
MAEPYRKNVGYRNPKKDVIWKAVCNKTKRKTKNEMDGRRVQGSEKEEGERMERQSKESRNLEAHCKGGQGPPRAVAPSKNINKNNNNNNNNNNNKPLQMLFVIDMCKNRHTHTHTHTHT